MSHVVDYASVLSGVPTTEAVSKHHLKWNADGVETPIVATPIASSTPGRYTVAITDAQFLCKSGFVSGTSDTSGMVIWGTRVVGLLDFGDVAAAVLRKSASDLEDETLPLDSQAAFLRASVYCDTTSVPGYIVIRKSNGDELNGAGLGRIPVTVDPDASPIVGTGGT